MREMVVAPQTALSASFPCTWFGRVQVMGARPRCDDGSVSRGPGPGFWTTFDVWTLVRLDWLRDQSDGASVSMACVVGIAAANE